MADNTGAPHFIPYVEPTDLVREYPAADEASAFAVAAALDAAGGLVAVKSAIFTGVQTESVTAGSNVAVTDLTITHAMADAGNRLIISAFFGIIASSSGEANGGIAIDDGSGLIAIGDAEGSRIRVTAINRPGAANAQVVQNTSVTFVHAPGDTTERTYTVRAINSTSATRTLFINRNEDNVDSANRSRAASGFVIQEVKV